MSHHITITGPDSDGEFGFRCDCGEVADGYKSHKVASGEADEHVAEQCGCDKGWWSTTVELPNGTDHDFDERCDNPDCRYTA